MGTKAHTDPVTPGLARAQVLPLKWCASGAFPLTRASEFAAVAAFRALMCRDTLCSHALSRVSHHCGGGSPYLPGLSAA